MRIGLIDSGIGGFNILSLCLKVFDDCEYLYLADTLYAPYGSQNPGFLYSRLIANIKFLRERQADLIILACSTACAILACRAIPNVLVIEPDITFAEKQTKGKILIFSTPITSLSSRLQTLARDNKNIKLVGDAYLAPLIECYAPNFDRVMPYFLQLLVQDSDCKSIVLGCTHYLFLSNYIKHVLPNVDVYGYELGLKAKLLQAKRSYLCAQSCKKTINLLFTSSINMHSAVEIAHTICPEYKIFNAIVKIP